MTEPTGRRIDGTTWDEARPPHLPDRLTSVSLWVYPFVLAAAVHVWLAFIDGLRLSSIVIALYGAALFLRHPDARRTLPLLVFGVVLLTVGGLLEVVSGPITRFLDGLMPRGDDAFPVPPAVAAWSMFTTLLGIFAMLYIGAGLAAARHRANIGPVGLLTAWLTVLAIASVVLSAVSIVSTSVDTSQWSLITFGIGLVLSLISTLVWTYLLVVSLSGWLAGESPRPGWALATVGAALFLAIRLVVALFSVFGGFSVSSGLGTIVLAVITYGSVLAWILLLVAFGLGMPSTEPVAEGDVPATPDPPAATMPGSATG